MRSVPGAVATGSSLTRAETRTKSNPVATALGTDLINEPMSKLTRPRIGFHAPIKDGLHESLIIAEETGCDAVQIFSRNPRGWKAKPLTDDAVALFRETRRRTKISPVLIHAKYLINLAAADEIILLKSI